MSEPIILDIVIEAPIELGAYQSGLAIGPKGDDGLSAYEVWLAQGNVGTEQDFLDSLKGEPGDEGDGSALAIHEQTYDHTKIDDFAAWLATNPLAGYLTEETDPVFQAWLATNPLVNFLTEELDPVFAAWLATNPLVNFLTEELDPVFAAWLATNPLVGFLTDETDPVVGAVNGIVQADGLGNISAAPKAENTDINTGIDNDKYVTSLGIEGSKVNSEVICIACSDEETDLTIGTKVVFRMPWEMILSAVRASVTVAPNGSTMQIDINENGISVLSTVISIDSTEKTSETADVPPVISDNTLSNNSEITIDIDQVGSTIAGKGLKIYLIGKRI